MSSSQQQNWLEQLAAKIPGFGGYLERERRRDVDKLHREHLADQLRRFKTPLNNITREMTETGRLFETKPLERVSGKLDKLENRIRYASYGYTGFFDVVKINESELDRLYQFDLKLADGVEGLNGKLALLQEEWSTKDGLKSALASFEQAIDELDNRFGDRHKAIESFGNP